MSYHGLDTLRHCLEPVTALRIDKRQLPSQVSHHATSSSATGAYAALTDRALDDGREGLSPSALAPTNTCLDPALAVWASCSDFAVLGAAAPCPTLLRSFRAATELGLPAPDLTGELVDAEAISMAARVRAWARLLPLRRAAVDAEEIRPQLSKTRRPELTPVALALLARVDQDARSAVDIAAGLAPTVVAVHACNPATPSANARFVHDWEASDLDVQLVLIDADPGCLGSEVADYIARKFLHRQVHVVISATPSATEYLPSSADLAARKTAQLERALHALPNVVVHWVIRQTPSERQNRRASSGSQDPTHPSIGHPPQEEPQQGGHGRSSGPPVPPPASDLRPTREAESRETQMWRECCEPTSLAASAQRRAMVESDLFREPGIQFATMCVTVIGATALCEVIAVSEAVTTMVVAITSMTAAQGMPLWWRLGGALVAWATITGFVVNHYGQLTFTTQDLHRLALLVFLTATLAPVLMHFRQRTLARSRPGRVPTEVPRPAFWANCENSAAARARSHRRPR